MLLNLRQRLTHFLRWQLQSRHISSKIPEKPTWIQVDHSKLPKVEEISRELVEHLERLSLVEFNNEEGLKRLSRAIKSANQLYMVNTDGIEPMDTVLENRTLLLRKDEVSEGGCKDEILANACETQEEYFVAPPGNITLKRKDKDYKGQLKQEGKGGNI